MTRIDEFKLKHGQEIGLELLNEIKSNYYISKHAQEQLEKRSDVVVKFNDGRIDFRNTKSNINNLLSQNILAYFNTDGSVNIALNEYYYFVFSWNEDRHSWTMITYKETSWYGINIFDKRQMALDGFDRQYK